MIFQNCLCLRCQHLTASLYLHFSVLFRHCSAERFGNEYTLTDDDKRRLREARFGPSASAGEDVQLPARKDGKANSDKKQQQEGKGAKGAKAATPAAAAKPKPAPTPKLTPEERAAKEAERAAARAAQEAERAAEVARVRERAERFGHVRQHINTSTESPFKTTIFHSMNPNIVVGSVINVFPRDTKTVSQSHMIYLFSLMCCAFMSLLRRDHTTVLLCTIPQEMPQMVKDWDAAQVRKEERERKAGTLQNTSTDQVLFSLANA